MSRPEARSPEAYRSPRSPRSPRGEDDPSPGVNPLDAPGAAANGAGGGSGGDPDLLSDLEETFRCLDVNETGHLSFVMFRGVFSRVFPDFHRDDLDNFTKKVWSDIDVDESDDVTWEEVSSYLLCSDLDGFCDVVFGEKKAKYRRPSSCREWMWAILEQTAGDLYTDQMLRRASFAFSMFIQLCIILSVGVLMLSSIPSLKDDSGKTDSPELEALEAIFIYIFTMELILRAACCTLGDTNTKLRSHASFWLSAWTWVDTLSILPFWLSMAGLMSGGAANGFLILRVLRLSRLLRVIRVLKLGRNSQGITIMIDAVTRGGIVLGWMLMLLVMVGILTAALMFYAERVDTYWNNDLRKLVRNTDSEFPDAGLPIAIQSIPDGLWWAVVTLTTVGYGDTYPVTALGKMIGTVTMLSGVMVLAFPVTVLTNSFSEVQDEQKALLSRQERAINFRKKLMSRMLGGSQDDAAPSPGASVHRRSSQDPLVHASPGMEPQQQDAGLHHAGADGYASDEERNGQEESAVHPVPAFTRTPGGHPHSSPGVIASILASPAVIAVDEQTLGNSRPTPPSAPENNASPACIPTAAAAAPPPDQPTHPPTGQARGGALADPDLRQVLRTLLENQARLQTSVERMENSLFEMKEGLSTHMGIKFGSGFSKKNPQTSFRRNQNTTRAESQGRLKEKDGVRGSADRGWYGNYPPSDRTSVRGSGDRGWYGNYPAADTAAGGVAPVPPPAAVTVARPERKPAHPAAKAAREETAAKKAVE